MTTGLENLISQSPSSSSSPASLARYNWSCRQVCLPAETRASSCPSLLLCFSVLVLETRVQLEGERKIVLSEPPGVPARDPEKRQERRIGMMNLQQDMDREQMRMAILNQEHIFRKQVHELHRLYHVQKQLMQQAQTAATASRAPAPVVDVKPRPQQLDIWCRDKATSTPQQQIISFTSCNKASEPAPVPASALAEECNLELTLATGPSSSSSNSSGDAERRHGKRLKASSNSDSGATAVSSTSTDSELAQFKDEVNAVTPARFHGEVSRRMDEMGQGPWMYQCLSLKMA